MFMTPRALLEKLSFNFFRDAHVGFTELTHYMQELRISMVSRIDEVTAKKYKNGVEFIVVAGIPGPSKPNEQPLPEESILENI